MVHQLIDQCMSTGEGISSNKKGKEDYKKKGGFASFFLTNSPQRFHSERKHTRTVMDSVLFLSQNTLTRD